MNERKNFNVTSMEFKESGAGSLVSEMPLIPFTREDTTFNENGGIRQLWQDYDQASVKQTPEDSKTKIISRIEKHLSDVNQRHLICVFGMNSDSIIEEALRELKHEMYKDLFILPRSRHLWDPCNTFAGTMINFLKSNSKKIEGLNDWRNSNEALRYCFEINSYYVMLEKLRQRENIDEGYVCSVMSNSSVEREEKCKELISFLKQQAYPRDIKFVWNIEVPVGGFEYAMLKSLSQLANENLIIIINNLGSKEIEAGVIGNRVGDSQTGHQVLQKFFWFEDIIQTD